MIFYSIEIEFNSASQSMDYRFASLFNGMRGTWCHTKEEAEKEGEIHKKLICKIYKIEEGRE